MEAKEREFSFMRVPMILEIPFFQRGYVWDEENWSELLDDLFDDNQSHFIGSIILKKQHITETGTVERSVVIDGQQRLTTLSILLRACYDTLPTGKYSDELTSEHRQTMKNILMYRVDPFAEEWEIKISHSRLDAGNYNDVIRGNWLNGYEEIVLESEVNSKTEPSSKILQCYKFFRNELRTHENSQIENLWRTLTGNQVKMLVKIDLGESENEQAIFDTVNSAGVRLTSADTIKNAIFQRAIEASGTPEEKDSVVKFYSSSWESSFQADQEQLEYWQAERSLGRIVRDNQEILLHCFALINGFYDPVDNKMSDLPMLYKEHIKEFGIDEVFAFIRELCDYADTYRAHFEDFDSSSLLGFHNSEQRLFHILDRCDISTLHPYILKILKVEKVIKGDDLSATVEKLFKQIETYALRHLICGITTKSFNKDCSVLVRNEKSIEDLLSEKVEELSDSAVRAGLSRMTSNKIAAVVLFWIELKRRNDGKHDLKELHYSYTLEHIMPQKWEQFWGIQSLPVIDPANNIAVEDDDIAKSMRSSAVYSIGNMTLLNSRLNTSLRNYPFKDKIAGQGRKKGISDYADLDVAREIVSFANDNNYLWNEISISDRKDIIAKEFLEIW